MAGIQTTAHHVRRGELFINQDLYIAIGRTTAWPTEASPPAEDPDTTDIDEIVCFVPASTKTFIIQDPTGLLIFDGLKWSPITVEEAYLQQANYVMILGTFTQTEVPLVTYRQYGLYSGLVKAVGAPNGPLLPEHVVDNGVLEAYHNHPPVIRTTYMSEERRFFTKF